VDGDHEHPRPSPTSPAKAVLILVAIAVATGFLGWQTLRTRQFTITTLSRPGTYRLTCAPSHPSSRRIHVSGWIDGTATFEITGGRGPETVGPGNVEWKTGGDWSGGDCLLKLTPGTAVTGELRVEYRFD